MSMKLLEINLLPAEFRKVKTDLGWIVDRRVLWPTMLMLVTAFGAFLVYLHVRDTISSLTDQLETTKVEIQQGQPILDKITELDKKLSIIGQKNKALKSIQVSKKRWVILFENISSVLPPNMWVLSLNEEAGDILEIKGTTFDFSEVAEYMVSLERQVSFTNVTLVTILSQKVGADDAYSFTLKCSINPDLGMEGQAK
jgi:type IV pilus assembly protein PilN